MGFAGATLPPSPADTIQRQGEDMYPLNNPFDITTQLGLKAVQDIWDWATGTTPVRVLPEAKERAAAIADHYKIPVTIATQPVVEGEGNFVSYQCNPLPEDQQLAKITQLERELSKMPAAALQKTRLSSVTLCGDLNGVYDFPLAPSESLHGLTNVSTGEMFLSAAHVFHHELFHQMWGNGKGCSHNILSNCSTDERWMELEPDKSHVDPNEERPEYARWLFSLDTPEGQKEYDQIMAGSGSKAKMANVKSWLLLVDPRLNEQFWSDLRNGNVGPDYWDRR